MEEKKEFDQKRKPDFSGREGIFVWINKDKNGNDYLTLQIPILRIKANLFSTKKID